MGMRRSLREPQGAPVRSNFFTRWWNRDKDSLLNRHVEEVKRWNEYLKSERRIVEEAFHGSDPILSETIDQWLSSGYITAYEADLLRNREKEPVQETVIPQQNIAGHAGSTRAEITAILKSDELVDAEVIDAWLANSSVTVFEARLLRDRIQQPVARQEAGHWMRTEIPEQRAEIETILRNDEVVSLEVIGACLANGLVSTLEARLLQDRFSQIKAMLEREDRAIRNTRPYNPHRIKEFLAEIDAVRESNTHRRNLYYERAYLTLQKKPYGNEGEYETVRVGASGYVVDVVSSVFEVISQAPFVWRGVRAIDREIHRVLKELGIEFQQGSGGTQHGMSQPQRVGREEGTECIFCSPDNLLVLLNEISAAREKNNAGKQACDRAMEIVNRVESGFVQRETNEFRFLIKELQQLDEYFHRIWLAKQ